MNVQNPDLVIVRGINSDWLAKNFSNLWVRFSGSAQAIPKEDAFYVGLYLDKPVSKITHLGIVEKIERSANGADFYLKALIKLKNPVDPGRPIRKHENWSLNRLGLTAPQMNNLQQSLP